MRICPKKVTRKGTLRRIKNSLRPPGAREDPAPPQGLARVLPGRRVLDPRPGALVELEVGAAVAPVLGFRLSLCLPPSAPGRRPGPRRPPALEAAARGHLGEDLALAPRQVRHPLAGLGEAVGSEPGQGGGDVALLLGRLRGAHGAAPLLQIGRFFFARLLQPEEEAPAALEAEVHVADAVQQGPGAHGWGRPGVLGPLRHRQPIAGRVAGRVERRRRRLRRLGPHGVASWLVLPKFRWSSTFLAPEGLFAYDEASFRDGDGGRVLWRRARRCEATLSGSSRRR